MSTATRVVALVLSGIFAGFLITVLVLELSMRDLTASTYTQVRLVELDHLDALATATLVPAVLATITLLVLSMRSRRPGLGLVTAALGLLMVVFVVTIAVSLPINSDQHDWSLVRPPADWADVRDRWQAAHVVRTLAALTAFACLVLASVMHSRLPVDPQVTSYEPARGGSA